jgi:dimethylargininase
LTFVNRSSIDLQKAREQHRAYAKALEDLGVEVSMLTLNETMPDGVFVEDTAVMLDELAVITSMGTLNRRKEVPAIATEISKYRKTYEIPLPATLEGGDVLRIGRRIYIGETVRTNKDAISIFTRIVKPLGYQVDQVRVSGCLHLKTGISALNEETFIANPKWLDLSLFKGCNIVEVPEDESFGGNVLVVNGTVLMNAAYPRTIDLVASLGFKIQTVDISEFEKAEAGLTCMSLIFKKTP